METSKHQQPKITLGEQEFQKVGNMNSEPTDLMHAPKNYDLYQDPESGTLVSKLPEHHPSYELHKESNESMEQKIKYLNIDLMNLNREEIVSFLEPGVKIYGKYTVQKYGSKDDKHNISYEGKLEIVIESDNRKYIKIKDGQLIDFADVVVDKNTTILKNRILVDSHFYDRL